MDKNKKIHIRTNKSLSYSEARNRNKKLTSLRRYNISNKHLNNHQAKKDLNIKAKENVENGENEVIKLHAGTVIGKLYKKTNETEWAAQNRAMKEKNASNYEIKQIIKRYNFNKGKLKYGFPDEYINLLTELLYSGKKDYSKERLQLSKQRINLSKKIKKEKNSNIMIYNKNILNTSENKNNKFRPKLTVSAVSSPYQNSQLKINNINDNICFNTFYNINKNSQNSEKIDNKKINWSNKQLNNLTSTLDDKLTLFHSFSGNNNNNELVFPNHIKNMKFNVDTIKNRYKNGNENESNNIYSNLFNNPNSIKIINELNKNNILNNGGEINTNTTIKSIDKSQPLNNNSNITNNMQFLSPRKNSKRISTKRNSTRRKSVINTRRNSLLFTPNKNSAINSPRKKTKKKYKNERDIYFEKEKEEDEFLMSGDKDKYEDYLKKKFNFYEDMEDKQTQYIYEIKKRNVSIFNNKYIEMQNNHKNPIKYLSKISREKKEKNNRINDGYKIHDLFKQNYTASTLNRLRLRRNSIIILKNLKL